MHSVIAESRKDNEIPEWTWTMHNEMHWAPRMGPTGRYGFDIVALAALASQNKWVTYLQLKKNPEAHAGKPWKTSGQIVEIHEQTAPPLTMASEEL